MEVSLNLCVALILEGLRQLENGVSLGVTDEDLLFDLLVRLRGQYGLNDSSLMCVLLMQIRLGECLATVTNLSRVLL